ncbi:MAG: CHRD domain-containing protein [Opitutales bacterium]
MKITLLSVSFLAAATAFGQIVPFTFVGAVDDLSPQNEVPSGTLSQAQADSSPASGFFTTLELDQTTNTFTFDFAFSDLSGGLNFASDSGIHFHLAGGPDFQATNGPVIFNLNNFSGTDNVLNTNTQIADGATGGTVSGSIINLTAAQEQSFLNGEYYLNIHSQTFTGGELRANVAPVPEPAFASALLGLGALFLLRRRA